MVIQTVAADGVRVTVIGETFEWIATFHAGLEDLGMKRCLVEDVMLTGIETVDHATRLWRCANGERADVLRILAEYRGVAAAKADAELSRTGGTSASA